MNTLSKEQHQKYLNLESILIKGYPYVGFYSVLSIFHILAVLYEYVEVASYFFI